MLFHLGKVSLLFSRKVTKGALHSKKLGRTKLFHWTKLSRKLVGNQVPAWDGVGGIAAGGTDWLGDRKGSSRSCFLQFFSSS
jgi:hypothetical protein